MHEHHHGHADMETTLKDYILFALVLVFIAGSALVLDLLSNGFSRLEFMRLFMAMFFLVFGIFKLLDLSGFANSFMGYDIFARRFVWYAYLYPFLELALALGYFADFSWINWPTLLLMAFGSIGVARELMRHSQIKCACLGTYIKLPLSTVSLVEDVAMGVMALYLIIKW